MAKRHDKEASLILYPKGFKREKTVQGGVPQPNSGLTAWKGLGWRQDLIQKVRLQEYLSTERKLNLVKVPGDERKGVAAFTEGWWRSNRYFQFERRASPKWWAIWWSSVSRQVWDFSCTQLPIRKQQGSGVPGWCLGLNSLSVSLKTPGI